MLHEKLVEVSYRFLSQHAKRETTGNSISSQGLKIENVQVSGKNVYFNNYTLVEKKKKKKKSKAKTTVMHERKTN